MVQGSPLRSTIKAASERRRRSRAKARAARSARQGALDTSANSSSASEEKSSSYGKRRKLRMNRRTIAQRVTDYERFENCGRSAFGAAVSLRLSDGHAGVAGVESCGSVWCCSVCSAKIAHKRQDELSRGLQNWWAEGNDVLMVTLTMRHNRGNKLSTLWDALSFAWGKVTSGRQWINEKGLYNLAGWTRVVEVTQGKKGWHVHIHALLFVKRDDTMLGDTVSVTDMLEWKARIVQRWSTALEKKGLTCVDDAQDMQIVARGSVLLGDYFTKAQDYGDATAREVTQGMGKSARNGNRTPFGILDDLIKYGESEDSRLWNEYVAGSMRRRQMTWGKGTRDLLGLNEEEQTDEDIANEEVGDAQDDVIIIPAASWWQLSAHGDLVADVLDSLETDGVLLTLALLHSWGVEASLASPDAWRDLGGKQTY